VAESLRVVVIVVVVVAVVVVVVRCRKEERNGLKLWGVCVNPSFYFKLLVMVPEGGVYLGPGRGLWGLRFACFWVVGFVVVAWLVEEV
jgi:hypothetical protein